MNLGPTSVVTVGFLVLTKRFKCAHTLTVNTNTHWIIETYLNEDLVENNSLLTQRKAVSVEDGEGGGGSWWQWGAPPGVVAFTHPPGLILQRRMEVRDTARERARESKWYFPAWADMSDRKWRSHWWRVMIVISLSLSLSKPGLMEARSEMVWGLGAMVIWLSGLTYCGTNRCW